MVSSCFVLATVFTMASQVATPPTTLWADRTHQDFQNGSEYYLACVGRMENADGGILRTWNLGAGWWAPKKGGLRILGRDLDLDGNSYKDVVLDNNESPAGIYVYWNGDRGFSSKPSLLSVSPYNSPQAVHIADLNCDGHPDVLVGTGCYSKTSYIFYGTDDPQVFRRESILTDYDTYGQQDLVPVDLNGDGYLDLWMACDDKVFLLHGPNLSYREPDKTLSIPGGYYHRQTFADLDNDGNLDVVMGSDNSEQVTIAYGPDFKRRQTLQLNDAWKAAACDLDDDGWLDLVIPSSSGNYIYWGSDKGFSDNNRTQLEGGAEGNCSITDLNNDGIPDLIISQIDGFAMGSSYIHYGPDYESVHAAGGGRWLPRTTTTTGTRIC